MLKKVSTNEIASEVLFEMFLLHQHSIVRVKKKKRKKIAISFSKVRADSSASINV